MIDNSTGFEDKMNRLITEISSFLGEPEPLEIERKFLIEYPDVKLLEADPACRRIEIIQTYLKSDNGDVCVNAVKMGIMCTFSRQNANFAA